MYIAASFKEGDLSTLHAFMRQYSFATLITAGDVPAITHLPLILHSEKGPLGTLFGHFARPNPHGSVDHRNLESVAVFHGPHAYISPTWYRDPKPVVPTWNYATVHAHGRLKIIDDHSVASGLLDEIALVYEQPTDPPRHNLPPREMHEQMTRAIIAFEMPIANFEGKFKLGQNRSLADQMGTIEGLMGTGDPDSVALAKLARDRLEKAILMLVFVHRKT